MKRIFLAGIFLSFCCASTFAADGVKTYKESINQWGASPLASKLEEKLATNNLDIKDVREILEQGSFPYNKSVHGLKKVAEGKKTIQVHYKTKFVADDFFIIFSSRSLEPGIKIPTEAVVTFLKKTKPDSISKLYEYNLTTNDGKVFNFNLTWQKVAKQSEEKMKERRHQQALMDATSFRRPSSIYDGVSPQDLQTEIEKAEHIEDYIAYSKAEKKAEGEKKQLIDSDEENSLSEISKEFNKAVARQRSYSALPSQTTQIRHPATGTQTLSSEMPKSKGNEPKSISFVITDLDSLRTKKEAKVAVKQINKRSVFAQGRSASSSKMEEAKKIAKAAQKTFKKQKKVSKKNK